MLKSGTYDFVICRGGFDMCFVLRFGWKHADLKQYCILGLTKSATRGMRRTCTSSTHKYTHTTYLFLASYAIE